MGSVDAGPRLDGVVVRSVLVPLTPPLQTASGTVSEAPVVLIDMLTEQGVTGRSYLFCYTPLALAPVAQLVRDIAVDISDEPLRPVDLRRLLDARFRLLRPQGLVTMAIAGLDMATWDAHAQAAGMPLATLLGGSPTPVPAYASLRSMSPGDAAHEAATQARLGFTAFKVKGGSADVAADIEVVRAVRGVVPDGARIAVDYNQSLTVPEAIRRIGALHDEGLLWVEEPTAADDHAGHARIRERSTTPIQLGESWWSTADMVTSITSHASDLAMVDVARIGGVTGWMRAAALAAGHGLPLSSHLYPEISAHLLAVSPGAHLLEHLDIVAPLLIEPMPVRNGTVAPLDRPGVGLQWNDPAVAALQNRSGTAGRTLTWSRT